MKNEGRFYCPPEFIPQAEVVRWDINHAYFSSFPEPAIDLKDKVTVQKSLRAFAKDMNRGRINELLDQHKKDNDFSPRGNFGLTAPEYGAGYKALGNDIECRFNIDGQHSIFLGWQGEEMEESLLIAVTSFNCGTLIGNYKDPNLKFAYPFPIILQLQGPHKDEQTYYPDDDGTVRQTALTVLSHFRWERALVRLVIEWARSVHIPALYLLPGQMHRGYGKIKMEEYQEIWYDGNRIVEREEEIRRRFDLRYDISARRCGFRLQSNGLYGISLLTNGEQESILNPGENQPAGLEI